MNCVVMSDSTCDFSAPQAKLEGVRIIPFHYEDAAGRLRGDDDLFTSLGAHEFYDLIRSGAQLFTSQPSQLEFEEAFTEVLDAGDEAVLFCISSGISGGYEGALMALSRVEQEHPDIPTHSVKAQNKLAKAEAAEEARYLKELSPDASAAVETLTADKAFLEIRPSLCASLTDMAKLKRVADNISPTYRAIGTIVGVIGIAAVLYGLYGVFTHSPIALYLLIGGGAAFFTVMSSNIFPSKYNSKKRAQAQWEDAVEAMRGYLKGRPSFSVPAQYAHPIVLTRTIRVLREGRAQSAAEALEVVKQDLRALNSSVTVSQKEHDEVVAVKPLFLVCDYRDEI